MPVIVGAATVTKLMFPGEEKVYAAEPMLKNGLTVLPVPVCAANVKVSLIVDTRGPLNVAVDDAVRVVQVKALTLTVPPETVRVPVQIIFPLK